jgi:hypothetical protein
MPTARELLEQADALMRRNRKYGKGPLDVPTLTDALGVDADALAPTLILPDAHAAGADPIMLDAPRDGDDAPRDRAPDADPMSLDTLADVPVLTDAVLAWPPSESLAEPGAHTEEPVRLDDAFPTSAAEAEAVAAQVQPPAVLEQEASDAPAPPNEPAPEATLPARFASTLEDEFILEIPPAPPQASIAVAKTDDSPIPAVVGPAGLAPAIRDWDALAEEIRMQVLQRLDLFTDTGLREQLGARLSPIVDRASAALVETINRELGELIRGYVAEAIEREIESWRSRK